MPERGKLGGVLFVVALASAGYVLISLLPRFIDEYQKAAGFHPVWGYIYLAVSLFVLFTFLALAGWAAWALIRNSRRKSARRRQLARRVSEMTPGEQTAEIRERLSEVQALADDAELPIEVRQPLRETAGDLQDKWSAETLEIVAFGTISSGKSSVLNALARRDVFRTDVRGGTTLLRSEVPWPGADRVTLVDTPGLAEVEGSEREGLARLAARDADLVLLVVDGPLKDFEGDVLEQLAAMEKPVIVCLNKSDWYADRDRSLLLEQITEQVQRWVPAENVVALRAQPVARSRVHVLADGTESLETVEVEPDIGELAQRMLLLVQRKGQDLLLANLLLRARGLVTEAKLQVQTTLDQRAREVVDRYMWQTAGAAALSPLPLLDVAAALALTVKMVLELARVYRQSVDLETATRLVSELGRNLVSILGATLATPVAGTAVASLLKTVPGVGTLAGGVLQGLIQAVVTRWTGNVFIVYFRNEMQEPEAGWAAMARANWQQVTRPAELAKVVRAGIKRLGGRE